jgi:D-alanine transaminase
LANVLLRQLSVDAGAVETILMRDGNLMEASSSAVHVVIGGEIRTPPRSHQILPGTTRGVMEELAARAGIPYRSTPVSEAELRSAAEVWISSTTREVMAVTQLDGQPVGNGEPGPVWRRLSQEFQDYKRELAGTPW